MPDLKTLPGFPFPPGGPVNDGPVLKGSPGTGDGGIGLPQGKLLADLAAFSDVLELDGYKERWRTEGDQSATRILAVPWSKRLRWRDSMLGYATSVLGPGGNPVLRRAIPAQHPEGGAEHLYVSDLELLEGRGAWVNSALVFNRDKAGAPVLGPDGNVQLIPMISYVDGATGADGYGVYACTYTPRNFTIRTDEELASLADGKGELERCTERSSRDALQALALPKGQVKFNVPAILSGAGETVPASIAGVQVAGQTIPDNASFILMPTKELHYVIHDWPDVNWASIEACEGKVNSTEFDGAMGCLHTDASGEPSPWPKYTLLCQPVQVDRYRTVRGRYTHRVEVVFLYRRQTWLRLPAGVDKNFYAVAYPNGDALFEQEDMNKLWVPAPPQTYQ